MVHLISSNSLPSQKALERISFINKLNDNGIVAVLYGEGDWARGKCNFKPLDSFNPRRGDTIIIDGVRVETRFDIINLGRHRFSFGRKKRIKQLCKYFFRYISLFFLSGFKVILYEASPFQRSFKIFDFDARTKDYDLSLLVQPPKSMTVGGKLYLFDDISSEKLTVESILAAEVDTVALAGAIVDPKYFKLCILPILRDGNSRKVEYYGFIEKCFEVDIYRDKPSSDSVMKLVVENWLSIFKKNTEL